MEPFLTIHGMDPKKWADRYGIVPFSAPCPDCGEIVTTTIPIAVQTLRGLMSRCICGHEGAPYCLVRDYKYGDLFDGPLVT
jgi:hypothetical protein